MNQGVGFKGLGLYSGLGVFFLKAALEGNLERQLQAAGISVFMPGFLSFCLSVILFFCLFACLCFCFSVFLLFFLSFVMYVVLYFCILSISLCTSFVKLLFLSSVCLHVFLYVVVSLFLTLLPSVHPFFCVFLSFFLHPFLLHFISLFRFVSFLMCYSP